MSFLRNSFAVIMLFVMMMTSEVRTFIFVSASKIDLFDILQYSTFDPIVIRYQNGAHFKIFILIDKCARLRARRGFPITVQSVVPKIPYF